jgi:hypothetical protein
LKPWQPCSPLEELSAAQIHHVQQVQKQYCPSLNELSNLIAGDKLNCMHQFAKIGKDVLYYAGGTVAGCIVELADSDIAPCKLNDLEFRQSLINIMFSSVCKEKKSEEVHLFELEDHNCYMIPCGLPEEEERCLS